jgi:zinc protease
MLARARLIASTVGMFIAALMLLSGALAKADSGVKTPPYERIELANGTVLLLMERHDVPLIAFDARVRSGARLDPRDRFGVANLLAGLLERGAGSRDALAFAEAVSAVGGAIQTSASAEAIGISGSFLARDKKLMVELLADMLQRPHLAPNELDVLRNRYIEFIRAAKDSQRDALTPIYAAAALFGTHPYGNPVVGSERSLANITIDDVREFYAAHVGGDRLIISVAGDFKTAEMRRLLTQAFAKWRKASAPLPPVAPPARIEGRRVVLVDAPDAVQSYFWIGNVGVARSDPRRAALDLVNTVFGGRFTSMLNTELRVRTGLSYGASSRFERLQQPGPWQMASFTRTETTIEAIDLALATLDRLHEAGLDTDMLASSRKYVLGQFPLSFETSAHWAAQLATLELYGLGHEHIDGYAAALNAVELTDAQRVIAEVFPKSDAVLLVVIGRAEALREPLKKYGPVTELRLADPVWTLPIEQPTQ